VSGRPKLYLTRGRPHHLKRDRRVFVLNVADFPAWMTGEPRMRWPAVSYLQV